MSSLPSHRDPLLLYTQKQQQHRQDKRRRLSIRPPTSSSLSNSPASYFVPSILRFRGRRSKFILLFVVLTTIGVVGIWIVNEAAITRGRTGFLEQGGFGKDFMGRDDDDDLGWTRVRYADDDDDGNDSKAIQLAQELDDAEPARTGSTDAGGGGLSKLCLLFPWRNECIEQLELAKDPFRWYEYVEQAGRILYPAQLKPIRGGGGKPATPTKQEPHPIHKLIRDANATWNEKLERQSKTLPEAIDEYEKRYHRRPPRGFDEWFYHALANDFVLRDEFDLVDQFVTPFLAVSPGEIKRRHEQLQFDDQFWLQDKTFTIELKDRGSSVKVFGPMTSTNPRPTQMLKLLAKISHNLPNMNITFTGHDQPWIVLSGESRAKHIAAARAGKVLPDSETADPMNDWTLDGWANVCPPGSPLRDYESVDARFEQNRIWNQAEPVQQKLIVNHTATMDLCYNPEGQLIHGFTSWIGPRPGILYPIFSSTTTSMHSDFLISPVDQYDYRLGDDPAWENKMYDKVVWRGSTTGADLNIEHHRKWSQRIRLCRLPFESGSKTLPYSPADSPTSFGPMSTFTARSKTLANRYFDFAFIGEPTQCDDLATCRDFEKQFRWDEGFMEPEVQNEYKYVIDIDGNGWSGRFHRLMSSNSLVLKSTIFPEWYSDMIQPWVHYVPISTDYQDLWSIMAFFKGDENGVGSHDDIARQLATNGKEWTEKH
ncbi:uncharacterized protein JCM15063_006491, partial [Sporobolomyces koalae]|uniref:uncharacterized protein n=1 Tax=Sporobolomyces koalae TaxID=500713 RepID=UPI0031727F02